MQQISDEERIRALLATGDAKAATTLVIETYGAEIYGYVMNLTKDEDVAGDAFSQACENVFSNLSKFRGQSSVRTWFYTIARHVAYRELKRGKRGGGQHLSQLEDQLAAAVRTAT